MFYLFYVHLKDNIIPGGFTFIIHTALDKLLCKYPLSVVSDSSTLRPTKKVSGFWSYMLAGFKIGAVTHRFFVRFLCDSVETSLKLFDFFCFFPSSFSMRLHEQKKNIVARMPRRQ